MGNLVMLSICNLYSDMSRCFRKPFISLFLVIRKLSEVAYQLELPSDITIHNVFHILLLYLYNSLLSCFASIRNPSAPPSHIDLDPLVAATLKRILGYHVCILSYREHVFHNNRVTLEFLVS